MRLTAIPLLLFLFNSVDTRDTDPPSSLSSFSNYLLDSFYQHSRFNLISREMKDISTRLRESTERAEQVLTQSHIHLSQLLHMRIRQLRKLALSSQDAIREYGGEGLLLPLQHEREECDRFISTNVLPFHVHNETNDVSHRTHSAIHINIESYNCDPTVMRDVAWTGMDRVEKTMQENARQPQGQTYPIHSQFIGTYSGVTRMFPRRKWTIEPPLITLDLFDPKFRPWFVAAEAATKDIVLLIDYSGSTKGPTMHLMRITLLYILTTLSPNDFISGVWFSHNFDSLLACNNRSFIPATTRNKKMFYERLIELEEKDQAALGQPLKYSLNMLREKSEGVLFGDSRSGSHKMIILLTDGVDEWPYGVIEDELEHSNGEKVRVYGLAMGFGTGHLTRVDNLACLTNATTALVDSISDVKSQSRQYLTHLSRVHAGTLLHVPMEERPISWSRLYMEAQGAGPVATLSTPITVPLNQSKYWNVDTPIMAAVAGVDIHIKEISKHLPNHDQMHGFVVDNNGIVLFHRDHVIPKTEVHAIRRSACYDASQVHHKAGSGLRVQYGHSDERVYRLVGLIDSIPTIDLYELEGNSTVVQKLRECIVMKKCDGNRIMSDQESTQYICKHIEDTPYTIVISDTPDRSSLSLNDKDQMNWNEEPPHNSFIHYHLSKRSACNWALDTVSTVDKFNEWMKREECHPSQTSETILPRLLTKSLFPWVRSWPQPERNSSCHVSAFPGLQFDPNHYINSFVHTRGQVTVYYPSCTWPLMKQVIRKLDNERLQRDNDDKLEFSVRNDVLVVYKAIDDEKRNRLAVVGVQWRLDFLSSVFTNWTRTRSDWMTKCEGRECLLLTRSAYVIASNTGRPAAPLASFDPQLFVFLRKEHHLKTEYDIDYQAECLASHTTIWSTSPSSRSSSFIRSIIHSITSLISSILSINFIALFSSFNILQTNAQPSMNNGICTFQKITPYERCALLYYVHTITTNSSKQIHLASSSCPRFARVHSLNGTSLTLVIADKACPSFVPRTAIKYIPRRLRGCEIISNHPRRRPDYNYTTTSPYEENLTCSSSIFQPSPLSTNLFIVIITYHFID